VTTGGKPVLPPQALIKTTSTNEAANLSKNIKTNEKMCAANEQRGWSVGILEPIAGHFERARPFYKLKPSIKCVGIARVVFKARINSSNIAF
jgi:hypothetical protein